MLQLREPWHSTADQQASAWIETEEPGPRLMLSKFASVRSAALSVIELDEHRASRR